MLSNGPSQCKEIYYHINIIQWKFIHGIQTNYLLRPMYLVYDHRNWPFYFEYISLLAKPIFMKVILSKRNTVSTRIELNANRILLRQILFIIRKFDKPLIDLFWYEKNLGLNVIKLNYLMLIIFVKKNRKKKKMCMTFSIEINTKIIHIGWMQKVFVQ